MGLLAQGKPNNASSSVKANILLIFTLQAWTEEIKTKTQSQAPVPKLPKNLRHVLVSSPNHRLARAWFLCRDIETPGATLAGFGRQARTRVRCSSAKVLQIILGYTVYPYNGWLVEWFTYFVCHIMNIACVDNQPPTAQLTKCCEATKEPLPAQGLQEAHPAPLPQASHKIKIIRICFEYTEDIWRFWTVTTHSMSG